jgi:hypothetical protein
MPIEVEFTAEGYLHIPGEIAGTYFPSDGLVALIRGPEMWLLPTHNSASGGLLLKQRNTRGDKTVLIWEVLRAHAMQGSRVAFWDDRQGALRVALEVSHGAE